MSSPPSDQRDDRQGPCVLAGQQSLVVPFSCDFEPPLRLPALGDLGDTLRTALATPLDSPPLAEVAGGAARVAVVVPDASRTCPTAVLLPALIDELRAAGVAEERIAVMVACGLHRTTSRDEKLALVGPALAGHVRVEDAQALRQTSLFLGLDRALRPLWMNLGVARADLVVSLGVVEPHLYAGFSGGAKTVAIGCAGEHTIAWTHSPAFLDQPTVRLGRLADNPFQESVREIGAHTALRFAVNVVMNDGGRVAGLAAGHPTAVQEHLVGAHRDAWLRSRDATYDLVVAGVPAPKSKSLYQASRAATYLGLAARPVVADDGLIVLCADLPLGVGDGPGEVNFGRLLAEAKRPAELVERGLAEPLGPGGQRAYMLAKVLDRCRVGVVGSADPTALEPLGLLAFGGLQNAFDEARRVRGADPRVLVVADGIDTVVERAG